MRPAALINIQTTCRGTREKIRGGGFFFLIIYTKNIIFIKFYFLSLIFIYHKNPTDLKKKLFVIKCALKEIYIFVSLVGGEEISLSFFNIFFIGSSTKIIDGQNRLPIWLDLIKFELDL